MKGCVHPLWTGPTYLNPTLYGPFELPPGMGGPLWPPIFLENYILYGVLVFIFMYIPINHVCMAIFRLHRFPSAALWRHFWPKWRHFGQNRLYKQRAIVSVKIIRCTWKLVSIRVLMPKIQQLKKNIVINVPLSIFGNPIVLLFTNNREQ